MYIAVNHVDDYDRLFALPDEWHVWPTADPIGVTYAEIAETASNDEWGHDTIVLQDDVRIESAIPPGHNFELVVYGTAHPDGFGVCPRAFSATWYVWEYLSYAWEDHPESLCDEFGLACDYFNTLMVENATHLQPVRSKDTDG